MTVYNVLIHNVNIQLRSLQFCNKELKNDFTNLTFLFAFRVYTSFIKVTFYDLASLRLDN